MERISTGIEGLDKLVEGGIPRGSTVLVAGNPGTGKTILTSHFLYDGLNRGESSIYVSFSESREQYFSNTDRFSMDFKKFENGGPARFTFLDFTSVNKDGIGDALDEVLSVVKESKARRIVVDSFSAIAQAFESQNDARIALQVILGKMTRAQGVTNMLITEVPIGQESVGSGIEEFVVDGIIRLEHGKSNAAPMQLRVVKMRGTDMNREPHVVSIGPKGMILYTKHPMKLSYHVSNERVTSGLQGLDDRMEGGLIRGSTTAVVGASGVGKTTFAWQFLAEGAKHGEAGIYCSIEESPQQIERMAAKFGYDIEDLKRKGLTILSIIAEEKNPDAFITLLSDLIKEKKPKRLVIDSISAFEHAYGDQMYPLTKRIVSLTHEQALTTVFTVLTQQEAGLSLTTMGISSLFDNIVLLRYVEAEGRMKRSLLLFKMRATAHDESILEFVISNAGIEVIGAMTDYVGIMTGVAQKIRQEFSDRETAISRREEDERTERLEAFEAEEKQLELERKNRLQAFQDREKVIRSQQGGDKAKRDADFKKKMKDFEDEK